MSDKIQIASDLHLEKFPSRELRYSFLDDLLKHDTTDKIILAGDIGDLGMLDMWLFDHGKTAWVVLGNHDYYDLTDYNRYPQLRGYPPESFKQTKRKLSNHLNIVPLTIRKPQDILHLTIEGDTGWTRLPEGYDPGKYVNDLRYINKFTKSIWQKEHNDFVGSLAVSDADIIVTHHAPSFRSISEKYRGGESNFCFASDLEFLMKDKTKFWIHGHVHDSFDYMIKNTRVICNPYGYFGREVNKDFDYRKFIEV